MGVIAVVGRANLAPAFVRVRSWPAVGEDLRIDLIP
ncbi:hypothetical protein N182_08945 [Sinorhizobium sp. GL2]|nr:hypothetical protein N182_08945 [Sinorhizobium sp. GL2]